MGKRCLSISTNNNLYKVIQNDYQGFNNYTHFTLLYTTVFYVFYLIYILYFLLWYDNTIISF